MPLSKQHNDQVLRCSWGPPIPSVVPATRIPPPHSDKDEVSPAAVHSPCVCRWWPQCLSPALGRTACPVSSTLTRATPAPHDPWAPPHLHTQHNTTQPAMTHTATADTGSFPTLQGVCNTLHPAKTWAGKKHFHIADHAIRNHDGKGPSWAGAGREQSLNDTCCNEESRLCICPPNKQHSGRVKATNNTAASRVGA